MDFFDDTSLRLSFFNSIFELLAGYNFAYAGLDIISDSINLYIIRNTKRFKLAEHYVINKEAYYNTISANTEKSDKVEAHLSRLNLIIARYKGKNRGRKFLKVRIRVKFLPLFLYCGFYCFYVLILSALSEMQEVVVFQGDMLSFGLKGVYSIRGYAFFLLFIFNTFSFIYLFYLALRNWEALGSDNKIKVISARPLFSFATIFFCCSAVISIFFRFYLEISPNDSLFFELITTLWSILICLSPILALSFWGFIGYKVKASVYSDISKEIHRTLRNDLTSSFLRRDVIDGESELDLTNYEDKIKLRHLLFFRFLKIYKIHLIITTVFFSSIIYFLYRFMMPREKGAVSFVRLSINKEFETYKSLPRVDTAWFDSFYTKNSSIRKKISERISYHLKKKEIINNNGNSSDHEIFIGRITDVSEDRIIVEINNFLQARWYDTIGKKYSSEYTEQTNDVQTYILKRENEKWLIDKSQILSSTKYVVDP